MKLETETALALLAQAPVVIDNAMMAIANAMEEINAIYQDVPTREHTYYRPADLAQTRLILRRVARAARVTHRALQDITEGLE